MGKRANRRRGVHADRLVVVVGDSRLILYEAFILVGVDTIDGAAEYLVAEVLAVVRGEEAVPVASDIEAEVPREVLAAHEVSREVQLKTSLEIAEAFVQVVFEMKKFPGVGTCIRRS